MLAASEADMQHFKDHGIYDLLKSRWQLTEAGKAKQKELAAADPTGETRKATFMATWGAAATEDPMSLTKAQFVDFTEKQVGNMKAELGEDAGVPDFSAEVAEKIFD